MLACDQLCHHDALVRCLMGQPGGTRDITDGIKSINTGAAEFVSYHMGAVDLDAQTFQPQPFDVADDAHGRDHGVEFLLLDLAANLDTGRYLALTTIQLLDHGFLHDLHALLDELLLGKG